MKTAVYINLHKVLVIPIVLGLMWHFDNWSVEAFVYLAMHGTYTVLWIVKHMLFSDKRFEEKQPLWIGVVFIFLPLAGIMRHPICSSADISYCLPTCLG